MNRAVIAYVPVLHEGYQQFITANATGWPFFVVGREIHADYRPLAKDIRALDPEVVAMSIRAWGVCSQVDVLTADVALNLAARSPSLVLPAEDVSYQVVEQYFPRCDVVYDTVFLRWDKTRTAQRLVPKAIEQAALGDALGQLQQAACSSADGSIDWWRQVGAAIRFADGEVRTAANDHQPHRLSAYTVGDPRANFYKGIRIELTTATHAEAMLIAGAARDGKSTAGAEIFVTDFPCPPCARLVASAGIRTLYFCEGYTMLDGEDVLAVSGTNVVRMDPGPTRTHERR